MSKAVLFSNQDGNVTGSAQKLAFAGDYMCRVVGTFDGATVKIQQLGPDDATWVDIDETGMTESGSFIVTLSNEPQVRGVISGGTAPVGIYMDLTKVG